MRTTRGSFWPDSRSTLLIVLGTLAAATVLGGCCDKIASLVQGDNFQTVTHEALKADYRADASAADAKYKGKNLRMSGVVSSSLNTSTAKWIFVYPTADPLGKPQVICALKEPGQMQHANTGSPITVHATFGGQHSFSKNFQFEDCVVEGKPDSDKADKTAPSSTSKTTKP